MIVFSKAHGPFSNSVWSVENDSTTLSYIFEYIQFFSGIIGVHFSTHWEDRAIGFMEAGYLPASTTMDTSMDNQSVADKRVNTKI